MPNTMISLPMPERSRERSVPPAMAEISAQSHWVALKAERDLPLLFTAFGPDHERWAVPKAAPNSLARQ